MSDRAVSERRPAPASSNSNPPRRSQEDALDDETENLAEELILPKGITGFSNDPPVNDYRESTLEPELAAVTPQNDESLQFEGDEEEPAEPQSFQRSTSPTLMQRNKGAAYETVGEEGVNRMHKFSLYETSTRFYLVGGDVMDKNFRVLKIDRTAPPGHLNIFEDDIVYDKREMNQLLNAIDDGNKGSGGMKLKCSTWGLLGFIRFTEAYYMLLITKRTQVAMIGGHYVFQIGGTEMVPLTTGSTSRFQKDRNPEEARFLSILNNLDLTRSFYFSYSYNITRSLQQNIIREREGLNKGLKHQTYDFNDMFVWNHYLLEPARAALKSTYDWCLPIIHGFIEQQSLDVFGRRVYITIIARRSRFFAGARFLKRGTNDLGYVANDVETEQIVSELLNTSFHAPGPRLYASPSYTSYIQHRGSIPLYWTQDNTGVTPKPDIDLNLIDPFYSAPALHFDNLFERYGAPIYVLNLIKSRERLPRESKLLREYENAIKYLNQSLPADKKILYEAFDMSRASKTRGQDVIGTLETIAEKVLQKTGFFHNGDSRYDSPQVQNGVARTNCIDCLDRTNAAQFVIGKRALGRQLQAIGIIAGNTVDYDTDAVNIFTHMFHGHGDTIAIQYGGSHLVNTMATYRKINQWQSHSRDMVESFKRYYHNSFLDSQRQEAYNLFLGNYIFAIGQPMLWDLTTDYYLHHADPRAWLCKSRRDYIEWFTPEFLEQHSLPSSSKSNSELIVKGVGMYDDYWLEYYRPLAISSFLKIYSFGLNSPARFLPDKSLQSRDYDLSPFRPRKSPQEADSPEKKPPRKGVTILDPASETETRTLSIAARRNQARLVSGGRFESGSPIKSSILRDPHFETKLLSTPHSSQTASFSSSNPPFKPADKNLMTQWTLDQFHSNSLNPSVTAAEAAEYAEYISHPLNLPLVVSAETPSASDPIALDFLEYLSLSAPEQDSADGAGARWDVGEEDVGFYDEFLKVSENPLDVNEDDGGKKRYKAYRQWLKGKSLFKQSKVDPEYQGQGR
ncbi:hypothetical protein BU16DRAFT_101477 [Lophium mytilinum]|uniref:SAC domain-containing protein n=1 Tax=Lophium mytilinum TaxID=390894 RepID=A0A6A6QM86_9PEZI|nr:hypothetical protein BU16DRAFT_101477 [Lophium mytilinum]